MAFIICVIQPVLDILAYFLERDLPAPVAGGEEPVTRCRCTGFSLAMNIHGGTRLNDPQKLDLNFKASEITNPPRPFIEKHHFGVRVILSGPKGYQEWEHITFPTLNIKANN